MNQSRQSDAEAIRSDIDVTRTRMDDTIDALGNRFQPRHLLDEFLGFFRRHEGETREKLTKVRDSISHSSEAVMHTVVDTIKQNPLPLLVIGAGVGWMIYSNRKANSMANYDYYNDDIGDDVRYDPDAHIDRPLDYPPGSGISEAGWSEHAGSKYGEMKEGASRKFSEVKGEARKKMEDLRHTAGDKMDELRHAASDKLESVRHRAGEIGGRVKERTEEVYSRTRQRVVSTADQHPLEMGLVCLAAGLVAGLLTPTPEPVNRTVGETADRLRDRTREAGHEMLEKGKRVADAAVSAVKDEAEAQGLTPEHLRDKASAVADRGAEAGKQKAREQGLTGDKPRSGGLNPEGNPTISPNDPTAARPAV